MNPSDAVAHLSPEHWGHANRLLVRKCLAEFSHERLLTPRPIGPGQYAVTSDDGKTEYRFTARVRALEHWHIDLDSITRHREGDELPLDALDFILDLRESLTLCDEVLPVYLEEITSTLASSAYKLATHRLTAAELARADFQTIEAGMTEGHPCFVANNGRLGLDIGDYHQYAPETGSRVRLVWVAAARDHAVFTHCADVDYDRLMRAELGEETLRRFAATLSRHGRDLEDYLLMPVHPWQWWNRLAVTYAGEVAQRRLVYLGFGDDEYQPQQSIRTFFNLTSPAKHYVKTALSVLNMGFLRGLSAEYMSTTPAINDWLAGVIASDPVLQRTGMAILREAAAVGYRHPQFHAATPTGSPYRKMLAALWRESPVPLCGPGERLATMASLLHVDRDGDVLVRTLIADSGLAPAEWIRRYLHAYLTPLLHCFYAYELVFMPHGENVILVLDERGRPRRAFFKDIAEEIAVMDPTVSLPPGVERIRATVPDELKALSLLTDVFDCFFRFLSALLHEHGILSEEEFWAAVATCVRDYQREHPEFADRYRRYDLFAPEFALSCLNRLQLRNNQQMLRLGDPDPTTGLIFAGTLANPIAR